MAGGLGDDSVGYVVVCGFGGEASAEAVAGEVVGVVIESGCMFFDDAGDCSSVDALSVLDGSAFVDVDEHWGACDVGEVDPVAGGEDGAGFGVFAVGDFDSFAFALLIGFGSGSVDDESFGVGFEVVGIESGEGWG